MSLERKCVVCSRALIGRQRSFCSRDCKNAQFYRNAHPLPRGYCSLCGLYDANIRVCSAGRLCAYCFQYYSALKGTKVLREIVRERRELHDQICAAEREFDYHAEMADRGQPLLYPPDSLMALALAVAFVPDTEEFVRGAERRADLVAIKVDDYTVNPTVLKSGSLVEP
jgi:hypothetical protein